MCPMSEVEAKMKHKTSGIKGIYEDVKLLDMCPITKEETKVVAHTITLFGICTVRKDV